MNGRKPLLSPEAARYLRRIGKLRERMPTQHELAARFGIVPTAVGRYERGEIKHYRETDRERSY